MGKITPEDRAAIAAEVARDADRHRNRLRTLQRQSREAAASGDTERHASIEQALHSVQRIVDGFELDAS